MPRALCASLTKAGRPCGFAARRETGLCVNHDPAVRELQQARRILGARRSVESRTGAWRAALAARPIDIRTTAGRLDAINHFIALEVAGTLPAPVARRLIRVLAAATNLRALPGASNDPQSKIQNPQSKIIRAIAAATNVSTNAPKVPFGQ